MKRCENPRIVRMRASENGARLHIEVESHQEDGKRCEKLTVFVARLARMPRVGEITEEEYLHLAEEAEISAATDMALRSLGACGASQQHLADKLRRRGVRRDVAEAAVAELAARGYLDEVSGALAEVKKDLQKLWGNRRILMDLAAKGYGKEAIEAARECLAEENAIERCEKLIARKRIAAPTDAETARRTVAMLVRQGYTPGECREALCRMKEGLT